MNEPMLTIELPVFSVEEGLPDADTDVLIFDPSHPEGQLGALVGHGAAGPQWVSAQGDAAEGVTHWAEMPRLPASEPRSSAAAACQTCGSVCNQRDELAEAEREIDRLRAVLSEIAQPVVSAPRDYMASTALAHCAMPDRAGSKMTPGAVFLPELMAIAVVSPECLAETLQLPPGAYIDSVNAPPDRPGVLELRLRGAGWPTRPGMTIMRTIPTVSRQAGDASAKIERTVIDWGFPSGVRSEAIDGLQPASI